jgi:hypothetical protein
MSLWLGFARLPAGKQAKLLLFRLAIFVFETRVGKIECLNQYSIFVKKKRLRITLTNIIIHPEPSEASNSHF